MKSLLFFLIVFSFVFACNKTKESKNKYHDGVLTISTDESFKSAVEALAEGYMIRYPNSKIHVKVQKEDVGFNHLLQRKDTVIILSRKLNSLEIKEFEKVFETKYQPSPFAIDAVVFVVDKNSPLECISVEDIKNELLAGSGKIILDGTNSSNINFLAEKFKKKPTDFQFSLIKGSKELLNQISKYPHKIGVVGYNLISRKHNKEVQNILENVKVLSISENGKTYKPEIETLRNLSYPFTRTAYFLTSENKFNIANGFIRFSCTHIGQKIIQKEGLQPYNIYKREVKIQNFPDL